MSEAASASVGMGGYGGFRPPFTAVQWQELEHQAMIYKYLVAGVPVPPDLVLPIRRSLEAISARFFPYPSLGYCSYYGKKFDPEPGRCRRTDGKKWRCSKDAHPDSKYCERHMHRGRNRSRKPVESQSSSPSLSSTSMSQISSGRGSNAGSFQNMPLYGAVSSEGSSFGSNATKLQMNPLPYAIDNKEIRYSHGRTAGGHSFSTEASGSIGNLGTSSANAWRLMPSQLQQHCFLGSEIGLSESVKQEQHSVHPFFSEWPSTKEPWSSLNSDDGSNMNLFSSTQLSISIPRPSSSFSPRSAYSPTDA